ncbi:hypothetical protein D9757_009720 [Collybiopsis confluens]|uniref:Inhibitor of growth protein N-terminal histone-binding domain-containing protein n=1 Tax=Collybiopsis confluens TaxID=2823264 RepID=A0A8H5H5L7_9AGAR|nr:hypothetical protein D9757_009720 [Collybiopsis confluens]
MFTVASAQSLEDAANLASEFVYSLEHVPLEVKHYLEEIRHKEHRVQELQQQIESDSARWIRHNLPNTQQESSPSSSPAPTPKSLTGVPSKIQHGYAEIERLSNEKMVLAEKITTLLLRTRSRLESDLNKVRFLQGEAPIESAKVLSAAPTFSGVTLGHDAAASLSESLKLALAPTIAAPAETRKSTVTAIVTTKRGRRITASPSIKLPAANSRSISPAAAVAPTKATSRSSRLSRQIHPPPIDDDIEMGDEDADGDDDIEEVEGEEGDDADDDKLYCFCQAASYGDMIACDNEGDCPYEWVGLLLSPPLPLPLSSLFLRLANHANTSPSSICHV